MHLVQWRIRFYVMRSPRPQDIAKNALWKQHGLTAVNQPQKTLPRSRVTFFIEDNVNGFAVPIAFARRGAHVRSHTHQMIAERIASHQALHTLASSMVTSALMCK